MSIGEPVSRRIFRRCEGARAILDGAQVASQAIPHTVHRSTS
jgi:hypothetical protein